jgi:hypothetical protein
MGYYSLLLVVEVLCMLDMHKGYLWDFVIGCGTSGFLWFLRGHKKIESNSNLAAWGSIVAAPVELVCVPHRRAPYIHVRNTHNLLYSDKTRVRPYNAAQKKKVQLKPQHSCLLGVNSHMKCQNPLLSFPTVIYGAKDPFSDRNITTNLCSRLQNGQWLPIRFSVSKQPHQILYCFSLRCPVAQDRLRANSPDPCVSSRAIVVVDNGFGCNPHDLVSDGKC